MPNSIRSRLRRLWNARSILRAARMFTAEAKSVLFVTSLLRAQEIEMATALRKIGWKVVLIYIQATPLKPEKYFDEATRATSELEAHLYAKLLGPRLCHVFSDAVDGTLYRFCADKPGPVVIDMNDVFCAPLFDYLHERFEPTRECLARADGLCARGLQAKTAERLENFRLPRHKILFPEYGDSDGPSDPLAASKRDPDDANIGRLAEFYEKVIADSAPDWIRMGYPYSMFRSIPVSAGRSAASRRNCLRASQRASKATVELEGARAELRRRALNQEALPASEEKQAAVSGGTRTPRDVVQAKRSLEIERGENWMGELAGLLNWPEIANPVERSSGMPELMEMIRLFSAGSGATSDPSSCWQVLGFKNFNQLLRDGYANFKRTVGSSYFNFLVQGGDPQMRSWRPPGQGGARALRQGQRKPCPTTRISRGMSSAPTATLSLCCGRTP
jgi:hypothetical protein